MKTSTHYIVSALLPKATVAGIVGEMDPLIEMYLTSSEENGVSRTPNETLADQYESAQLAKEMMLDYINGCAESDDSEEAIEAAKASIKVYKIEVTNHGVVAV